MRSNPIEEQNRQMIEMIVASIPGAPEVMQEGQQTILQLFDMLFRLGIEMPDTYRTDKFVISNHRFFTRRY